MKDTHIIIGLLAIFVLLVFGAVYSEYLKDNNSRNCKKAGGTLIQEYKSSLYVCAKVEKIKYQSD